MNVAGRWYTDIQLWVKYQALYVFVFLVFNQYLLWITEPAQAVFDVNNNKPEFIENLRIVCVLIRPAGLLNQ